MLQKQLERVRRAVKPEEEEVFTPERFDLPHVPSQILNTSTSMNATQHEANTC